MLSQARSCQLNCPFLLGVESVETGKQWPIFKDLSYLGAYLFVCVGMCICVLVPAESRGWDLLGAGVRGSSELPDVELNSSARAGSTLKFCIAPAPRSFHNTLNSEKCDACLHL